ncbi:MAG: hypothetical protein ABDH91_08930, partial [Bacteroidia bacterium]
PPERPNVFLWIPLPDEKEESASGKKVKKVKLASGEGKVYERELLELTREKLEKLGQGSSGIVLSEQDKKKWVEEVYEALEEKKGSYIQNFYSTLEAVRAGLVAEHRKEAQDVFRHLATVSALAESQWEECRQEIEKLDASFANRNFSDRRTREEFFIEWEKRITARFFVQVPFYLVSSKHGYPILRKPESIQGLSERVKRRLKGVYLLEGFSYSSEKGLYPEEKAPSEITKALDEQIL